MRGFFALVVIILLYLPVISYAFESQPLTIAIWGLIAIIALWLMDLEEYNYVDSGKAKLAFAIIFYPIWASFQMLIPTIYDIDRILLGFIMMAVLFAVMWLRGSIAWQLGRWKTLKYIKRTINIEKLKREYVQPSWVSNQLRSAALKRIAVLEELELKREASSRAVRPSYTPIDDLLAEANKPSPAPPKPPPPPPAPPTPENTKAWALKVMELKEPFTQSDLKKRRTELLKKVHPDQGGSNVMAQMVNDAYTLLKS